MILDRALETVAKADSKHSKPKHGNARQSGVSCNNKAALSVGAGWLHQREQFVDGLLRDHPHTVGIFHSSDVDAFHDRSDFVRI